MRRKWIVGLAALAVVGATAGMATAVVGGGSEPRPDYATVNIKMEPTAGTAGLHAKKKKKKPTMIYLQGPSAPVDVTPSPPGTGAYIDVRLSKCPGNSRVIEGGVVPENVDVYEQGAYLESNQVYHVLIGFEDEPTGGLVDFNLSSHLTCIKGVK